MTPADTYLGTVSIATATDTAQCRCQERWGMLPPGLLAVLRARVHLRVILDRFPGSLDHPNAGEQDDSTSFGSISAR